MKKRFYSIILILLLICIPLIIYLLSENLDILSIKKLDVLDRINNISIEKTIKQNSVKDKKLSEMVDFRWSIL